MSDKEERKEIGVWIVYDLEANREIQNLLSNSKYEYRFDPNLNTATKSLKDEVEELKKEAYMKLKDLEKMRKLIEKNKSLKKKIEELEK